MRKKIRALKRDVEVFEQKVKTAFEPVEAARKGVEAAQHGVTVLVRRHAGTVDPPEPEFAVEPPEPLFSSAEDYITATRKLEHDRLRSNRG